MPDLPRQSPYRDHRDLRRAIPAAGAARRGAKPPVFPVAAGVPTWVPPAWRNEVVSDADAIARILHGARALPAPAPPGQLLLLP